MKKAITIILSIIIFMGCASTHHNLTSLSDTELLAGYRSFWTFDKKRQKIEKELQDRNITFTKRIKPKPSQYVYVGDGEYKWDWLLQE